MAISPPPTPTPQHAFCLKFFHSPCCFSSQQVEIHRVTHSSLSDKYFHVVELIEPYISPSGQHHKIGRGRYIPVEVNVDYLNPQQARFDQRLNIMLMSRAPVVWYIYCKGNDRFQFIVSGKARDLEESLSEWGSAVEEIPDNATGESYLQWATESYGKPLYYTRVKKANKIQILIGAMKTGRRKPVTDDVPVFKGRQVSRLDDDYVVPTVNHMVEFVRNYFVVNCHNDVLDVVLPYYNLKYNPRKYYFTLSDVSCKPDVLPEAFHWRTSVGKCGTKADENTPKMIRNEVEIGTFGVGINILIHEYMSSTREFLDYKSPTTLPIYCKTNNLHDILFQPPQTEVSYRAYGYRDDGSYPNYPINLKNDKILFLIADLRIKVKVEPFVRARFDNCWAETAGDSEDANITRIELLRDGCMLDEDMLAWKWRVSNHKGFIIGEYLTQDRIHRNLNDYLTSFHAGVANERHDDLWLEEGLQYNYRPLSVTNNSTVVKCTVSMCVKSRHDSVPGLLQCARGLRDKCRSPMLTKLFSDIANNGHHRNDVIDNNNNNNNNNNNHKNNTDIHNNNNNEEEEEEEEEVEIPPPTNVTMGPFVVVDGIFLRSNPVTTALSRPSNITNENYIFHFLGNQETPRPPPPTTPKTPRRRKINDSSNNITTNSHNGHNSHNNGKFSDDGYINKNAADDMHDVNDAYKNLRSHHGDNDPSNHNHNHPSVQNHNDDDDGGVGGMSDKNNHQYHLHHHHHTDVSDGSDDGGGVAEKVQLAESGDGGGKCNEGTIAVPTVVLIAIGAFGIGALLVGTLWCIHSRTGHRKKKVTGTSRCMPRATLIKKNAESTQGTLTNQTCCPTFANS
ncbi:hypothetical protein HELRODRAFT_190872 [Helobdella robusta]|uniref:ZP domain-containing protein n=1 Tax=Helobdella robusta TaxID=6412 RepID=T1FSD5_HELRO|nr:hypothetical protein HELRODRAFT_190872 [Helobdella robusta]ESO08073.1 hypothetical protein HELRODRAFT_190872 [Helobdella robusta]